MTRILVVGEDDLACALGEGIVRDVLPGWAAAAPAINARGVTKLAAALPRYNQFAHNLAHVLCIADCDGGCPVEILAKWLPGGTSKRLILRLAVNEAESWALGDRRALAEYFRVPLNLITQAPDELQDPKQELLTVLRRSGVRQFRDEMIVSSRGQHRPGVGYNVHLRHFVRTRWHAAHAEQNSPSLKRALNRVRQLVQEPA